MLKTNFTKILESLEILTAGTEIAETRSNDGSLLVALQNFTFLSYLGFWSPVLAEINHAQAYMQKKYLSIGNYARNVKALSEFLETSRENADESLTFAESLSYWELPFSRSAEFEERK